MLLKTVSKVHGLVNTLAIILLYRCEKNNVVTKTSLLKGHNILVAFVFLDKYFHNLIEDLNSVSFFCYALQMAGHNNEQLS